MTEFRPWGSFDVLLDGPNFKVKLLVIDPLRRISLQYHRHRREHWFVVSGEGVVTIGDQKISVRGGSAIDINYEMAHRVENTLLTTLTIIEVQTGESFDENDIVRLDDDFGRDIAEGKK